MHQLVSEVAIGRQGAGCILEELVGNGEDRFKVPLADDRSKFKSLRPLLPPTWGNGASVKNNFP
jgi:hypothetical protein